MKQLVGYIKLTLVSPLFFLYITCAASASARSEFVHCGGCSYSDHNALAVAVLLFCFTVLAGGGCSG
ncbi:hypothetical protein IWZ01DRAFT_494976 [Phyllosticta capitalensis]